MLRLGHLQRLAESTTLGFLAGCVTVVGTYALIGAAPSKRTLWPAQHGHHAEHCRMTQTEPVSCECTRLNALAAFCHRTG
jgi:hypothetical protein